MHGTHKDHETRFGLRERIKALISGLEGLAHDLLYPPIWRITLTLVSFVTTTYGLMLLYRTFAGDGNGTLWFLRYLLPIAIGGALHSAIFYLLTNWAATGRRKYLRRALPLQALAILASFGTHWVGMLGGSATLEAFQRIQGTSERGIMYFAASYSSMADEMAALAAHSKEEALVEAKGGGNSCGVAAGNGKGPRYALRTSDMNTFTEFDSEIRARKTEVDRFVQRAEALNAGSADQAMARLATLRTLVNEAQARFVSDPLLAQIRQAAEARIVEGKGQIAIAPDMRRQSGTRYFTCFDPVLQRRLQAVIAAINNLKPLPNVEVPDYRDPDTGFPFALWRLTRVIGSWFSLPSRASLMAQRARTLEGRNPPPGPAHWQDLMPLLVAASVESFLIIAFAIGREPFSPHPGKKFIERAASRQDEAVFDRLWVALGGRSDPDAVRRTISAHSKFEGHRTWVFVPLYAADDTMRILHAVMEMLVEANMARREYTGRGLMARWYMRNWDPARRARLLNASVCIYRMTAREYMTFLLDALARKSIQPHDPNASDEKSRPKLLIERNNKEAA